MNGNIFPNDVDSFNFSLPDISNLNASLNLQEGFRVNGLCSSIFSQDKQHEHLHSQQQWAKPKQKEAQNLQTEGSKRKVDSKTGCNCKKAKCLKKYCSCYSGGKACNKFCVCIDCSNTQANFALIAKTVKQKQKKINGCKCKKTHCLKKYCACWNQNKKCSQGCECENCFNNDKNNEQQVGKQELGIQSAQLIQLNPQAESGPINAV